MSHSLSSRLTVFVLVSWLVLLGACAGLHPPPNLTQKASAAWTATQAIHTVDMVRDIAIAANDQMLFSTASTRAVVLWHRDAIDVIHTAPSGWQDTVGVGLRDLDRRLSAAERARLAPYLKLVTDLLSRRAL